MRVSLFMRAFFVLFAIVFLGGIIFNVLVFKDCTDRGNALYQCAAAMNNGQYVAYEEMGNEE